MMTIAQIEQAIERANFQLEGEGSSEAVMRSIAESLLAIAGILGRVTSLGEAVDVKQVDGR